MSRTPEPSLPTELARRARLPRLARLAAASRLAGRSLLSLLLRPEARARLAGRSCRARLALFAGLVLPCFAACSQGRPTTPTGPVSVLLVTLDTTRADALGPYGTAGATAASTPNLSALAAESVVFEHASTVAPLTLPAHASILTGLYPPRHTVRDNGVQALPDSARTLAEGAHERGYQTAAFVASVVLDAGFGLNQGFDVYDVPARPFGAASTTYAERPGWVVAERVTDWLDRRDRTRPFFLWMHLWDPHAPYEPPPALGAKESTPYLGEVATADAALGIVLAHLEGRGDLAELAVVVVADHGEAFGEHGEWSHAAYTYDTTLHVPLLLRDPSGHGAGTRSSATVSVADVAPTLAEAMGFVLPGTDGLSLWRREVPAARGVYFESYYGYLAYGWSPLTGWRDARGKYLHSSRPELYDTRADPGEAHDRAATAPAAELARYRAAIEGVVTAEPLERGAPGIAEALRRDIESLGYAAFADADGTLPHPFDPALAQRKSPAAGAQEQRDVQAAMGLLETDRLPEAEALLRRITSAHPENLFALDKLSVTLMRQGRFADALVPLRRTLATGPPRPDVLTHYGACLMETGADEDALAAFLQAVELEPTHVEALEGAARMLERLERQDEARDLRARLRAIEERL